MSDQETPQDTSKTSPQDTSAETMRILGWTEGPLDDEFYHRGPKIRLPLPTQKFMETAAKETAAKAPVEPDEG